MFAANVGGLDRTIRVVGGIALLTVGVWMRLAAGVAGSTPVILVGVLALFSGLIRFCILYVPFGISTARRETGRSGVPG